MRQTLLRVPQLHFFQILRIHCATDDDDAICIEEKKRWLYLRQTSHNGLKWLIIVTFRAQEDAYFTVPDPWNLILQEEDVERSRRIPNDRHVDNNCSFAIACTLFRNSGFVVKLIVLRNASKFAIFYIYENTKLLFPIFISCYFIFFPNEWIDQA